MTVRRKQCCLVLFQGLLFTQMDLTMALNQSALLDLVLPPYLRFDILAKAAASTAAEDADPAAYEGAAFFGSSFIDNTPGDVHGTQHHELAAAVGGVAHAERFKAKNFIQGGNDKHHTLHFANDSVHPNLLEKRQQVTQNSSAQSSGLVPTNTSLVPDLLLKHSDFIKGLCVLSTMLVQISPLPQVVRWYLRGCTGEADAAPLVFIAWGSAQWTFYGLFAWWVTLLPAVLILFYSNFLGVLLGTFYVTVYANVCRCQKSLTRLSRYGIAVFVIIVMQATFLIRGPNEKALALIGLVSSLSGLVGALSITISVPQVLRSKDSTVVSGPLCLATLVNSMLWATLGLILSDPLVVMPACASSLAATTCLILKGMYSNGMCSENSSGEQGMFVQWLQNLNAITKPCTDPGVKQHLSADEFTPLSKKSLPCTPSSTRSTPPSSKKLGSYQSTSRNSEPDPNSETIEDKTVPWRLQRAGFHVNVLGKQAHQPSHQRSHSDASSSNAASSTGQRGQV